MADVLNTSPSVSSVGSYSLSPSNYEMGRADYEEEGLKRAFKDLMKLTIPITITSLFVSLLLAANLIWIGHHSNTHQFAGAALGNMIVNVMGNSIIIGMTSGLDTQCGQAFGARLYKMMGVLVQRSICISHITIVIITIVFWFAEDLLLLAGQQKQNATEAGIFIRIFIASLWPIAMFGNLRRFLQAQRQVIFIPVAVLLGLIAQIICLLVFVNTLDWGYIGACVALPCSYWTMFGSLFFFTKCNKPLKRAISATWPGWGAWALKDWGVFLKLSVPGTFQLCAEWWALEVMALFAGHFGSNYVSAFTVTLNAIGVFARLPLGISFSAAVLVGNKLGAARPMSAKIIYDCATGLSVVTGIIFGAVLWLGKHFWARIYTHKEDVIPIVEDALPYCAVYFFFYAYQRGSAGGCRGMGRQNIGAAIYIVAYYFVGMPLGIWFGFSGFLGNGHPMNIKGLWLGATVSATIGSFFFLFFRLWVNWDREVDRAQARIQFEQDKMANFKEDVHAKFGDIMDDQTLLEDSDKDLNDDNDNIENLGSFKLDQGRNDHVIYDETEDNVWGQNREPIGYTAPDQSRTINSLPSKQMDSSLNMNHIHGSMDHTNAANTNPDDASLMSDVLGNASNMNGNINNNAHSINNTNNNNNQHTNDNNGRRAFL